MFKRNLRYSGPVLVLISGLISCAPDNKQKDVYIAAPPKIVRNGVRIDAKVWDQSGQKDLDLQDSIDVQAAKPATVDVVSRCRRGGNDMFSTKQLIRATVIPLFQVLPPEVLASDLKLPITCNLEVTLKNGEGSRHIFNLGYSSIKDERSHQAAITRNGEPIGPRERITTANLSGLKLRATNPISGQVSIVCEDAKTSDIAFPAVADISDLDFNRMAPYNNKPLNALELRPLQLCRAIVMQNNIAQAMTGIFELQFSQPAVKVTATHLLRQPVPNRSPSDAFMLSSAVEVGNYRIENPSTAPRWIRSPKHPQTINVMVRGKHFIGAVSKPFHHFMPKATAGAKISEEKDFYLVTIAGKSSVEFSSYIKIQTPLRCTGHDGLEDRSYGLPFQILLPHPIQVEELTENGARLNQISINLGPRIYLSADFKTDREIPYVQQNFCNW